MIEDQNHQNLKTALSQLSQEDREKLLREIEKETNLTGNKKNGLPDKAPPKPELQSTETAAEFSDIKAKLSMESEPIRLRDVISCLPWVLVGGAVFLGLSVGLKGVYEWLKQFLWP